MNTFHSQKEHGLNRRDFLKLLSLLPPAAYLPADLPLIGQEQDAAPQNILIMVYDAWSAQNVSTYGYPRQTTPNIDRLAEKAIVYHNHYSGGIFTYPGTISLLTGTYNWTHKGYYYNKVMDEYFNTHNLFSLFGTHHRISYTHNPIAKIVIKYMLSQISEYIPPYKLYLNEDYWLPKIFENDYDTASVSWVRSIKKFDDGYANSLFLSRLYDLYHNLTQEAEAANFPLGLPSIEGDNYFILEDATDWIASRTRNLKTPYLGYFHLLPPHAPYRTRKDFFNIFREDDYKPVKKPDHVFTQKETRQELMANRNDYDEYLLYVDEEFNRLYNHLEAAGQLENTWVILTSDHGEMFERGIKAHGVYAMFQPLIHVPLMIFPPGQQERVDIHTPSSATDLIPTLLHLTGKPQADWLEGTVLPPFNTEVDPQRPVFSMDTRFSEQEGPFTNASVMMRKGDYKLTYNFGDTDRYSRLNGEPLIELFDVVNDPEELDNLYGKENALGQLLLDELIAKMKEKGAA